VGSNPLEVTLRYRVSPTDVSPYWLGDPDTYLSNSSLNCRTFRSSLCRPAARPKSDDLSHAVTPSSGCYLHSPPARSPKAAYRTPLMEFVPLRRLSPGESTTPGLPHRVRSALRVSHPLDGLLLAWTFRPCFMPVTPLGFTLQGLSPTAGSRDSSPRDYSLMTFSPRKARAFRASLRQRIRTAHRERQTADPLLGLPLQGLIHSRDDGQARLHSIASPRKPPVTPRHNRSSSGCAPASRSRVR
jgi:hypothetical protein